VSAGTPVVLCPKIVAVMLCRFLADDDRVL